MYTGILVSYGLMINNQIQQNLNDVYHLNISSETTLVVILIFISCVSACVVIAVGTLIVFHCYLYRKGITTYQYVINNRRKEKNKRFRVTDERKDQDSIVELYEPYVLVTELSPISSQNHLHIFQHQETMHLDSHDYIPKDASSTQEQPKINISLQLILPETESNLSTDNKYISKSANNI